MIITATDTGLRRGELFKLKWKDIDFLSSTIIIQATNSKTEKQRTVGMTPRIKQEIKQLWESSAKDLDGLVFGIKHSIKNSWKSACEESQINDLRFHDLRHTATTRMIRAGIPHTEVMKITGHTQVKTFLRYLNLTKDRLLESANILSSYNDKKQTIEADSNFESTKFLN